MAKIDEINYLSILSARDRISIEEVYDYHLRKPFCDHDRARYLMDVAQILQLMPPPPARILDAGVGSGWTSKMFAQSGYEVVGIDISPNMILLAEKLCAGMKKISFQVADYEKGLELGVFDCAVIYEALHHADNPGAAVASIFAALRPGGMLITVEPGRGHEKGSVEIIAKYGTTEKDMEFSIQESLMRAAGFSEIKKYMRLSAQLWLDISTEAGEQEQQRQFGGALYNLRELGQSSVVVARK